MIDFIKEWWFLLLITLVPLSIAIYRVFFLDEKYGRKSINEPGYALGIILLAGLILPQIFHEELSQTLTKNLFALIYLLYLGTLLILSYKIPEKTFLFRILSELTKIMSIGKTEKMPLIWGLFIVIFCPIIYVIKTYGL